MTVSPYLQRPLRSLQEALRDIRNSRETTSLAEARLLAELSGRSWYTTTSKHRGADVKSAA